MSSHRTLTEEIIITDTVQDVEQNYCLSLVNNQGGDSLAVDNNGVVDSQSKAAIPANTSTATTISTPSDSSDADSHPETSVSGGRLSLLNSPSHRPQSFRRSQPEAYREKETITPNSEDVGQNMSTSTAIPAGTTGSSTTTSSRYPPPMFCPLTRHLFQDPVVAPDGHTYERDVLLQSDHLQQGYLSEERLYPNRALQQLLDEEPGRGPALLEQLWENSLWPADRPLSDAYYCPITFELMHVPVIDPEGNTYEKAAIVHWLRVNGHSPISRSPLTVTELYPNHVIRELLEYHANDKPNHPALSKWKSEPPPDVPEPADIAIYPSTFEELEAHHARMRRQRRKVIACTILGVVCLILAIIGAASYGGYCIFISIWLGCCVRDSCRRLRELRYEHHQERLSLEEAQQRVQALHERLRRLQQQEEQDLQRLTTESDGPQFQQRIENDVSDDQRQTLTVQRVEAIELSTLPLTDRVEQSLQCREEAELDQQESQQGIEGIRQPQEVTLPMTCSTEQVPVEEPEVDLEEGLDWTTPATVALQDPSLTANEPSVMTVNVSEPLSENSFCPVEDDDIEVGPVEIAVGPATTSSKD